MEIAKGEQAAKIINICKAIQQKEGDNWREAQKSTTELSWILQELIGSQRREDSTLKNDPKIEIEEILYKLVTSAASRMKLWI